MDQVKQTGAAVMGDRELIERLRDRPSWMNGEGAERGDFLRKVADRLEALASLPVRDGWVLVPKVPTREMWAEAGDAVVNLQHRRIGHHDKISEAVWTAMLSAAPKPEGAG